MDRWIKEVQKIYFDWEQIQIFTSISTWGHSQNSLPEVVEVLTLKISSYGTSLKLSWRLLQSTQE